MSDPVTIMAAIDADLEALDRIGRELDITLIQYHEADEVYDEAYEEELALLVEEYGDKRLPGEDVRKALIHKRLDPEIVRNRRRLERRVQRLTQEGRRHEKTLSGLQSELGFLRAEGNAPQARGPRDPITYGRRAA